MSRCTVYWEPVETGIIPDGYQVRMGDTYWPLTRRLYEKGDCETGQVVQVRAIEWGMAPGMWSEATVVGTPPPLPLDATWLLLALFCAVLGCGITAIFRRR